MKTQLTNWERWDREADVVVIGYGAAGAIAAITAHDAGAKVLILEKAPKGEEGGSSRVAGQGWLNPTRVDGAVAYLNALCGAYTVPQDMVRAWAEEMARNSDWIRSLGGTPVEARKGPEGAEFPEFPGADCIRLCQLHRDAGHERLWKLLSSRVEDRGIDLLYATPGRELIQSNASREVIGVSAEREGKPFRVKARRAVVLTCGGFENNQEMVRNYLPNLPYCYPLGTPYNTGDGISMAMAAGADLWHMNNMSGPWYSMKVAEYPSAMEIVALHYAREFPGGMIVVGGDGKRFMNEKFKNTHGKARVAGQWVQVTAPCPMFMVFDHTLFSHGPLYDENLYHGWNAILHVYDWSKDNSIELARGWIKKAHTVKDLAKGIGLTPNTLEQTISNWNRSCVAGKDPEFGRTRMLSPIENPPFYALELSPVFVNTQGGPKRNAKGQILRPNGTPIPRLYSAGELGSIYSHLYQAGGNIGECMAFGRISGRNAAAETPRG